jgi:RimJ/RimL family protein N-acetyltransferase
MVSARQALWTGQLRQRFIERSAETAFVHLALKQVVSFTTTDNRRSWRVMQQLGMQRDPGEDFEHPDVPPGHPLRRHVLYRLDAITW